MHPHNPIKGTKAPWNEKEIAASWTETANIQDEPGASYGARL